MAARFHLNFIFLAVFCALSLSTASGTGANVGTNAAGPTLRLNFEGADSPKNPVAEFMYFVPLISKEPVSVVESPGNAQFARMVAAQRAFTDQSFLVTCEFEFAGDGCQQNIFDHTAKIKQREQSLKAGGSLKHQLGAINIEGAGCVSVRVTGTVTNHVPTVTEVQLRFSSRGRNSPVTIDLHDIYYADGAFCNRNDCVANVGTLAFHRQAGPAKMEISLTSIRSKDAGRSVWQNFKASLKGVTANLFIKPIAIDPAGNETMLNFGRALATQASKFTFPLATNRQSGKMEVH